MNYLSLELKSRKENFNRIMPDLDIDMHSNPFGDQDGSGKNFDQISVRINKILFLKPYCCLVKFRRSITINITKC
jgi:hypothetical protein